MERLNRETLARLVDEAPTPGEEALLAADPEAAAELEALKRLTEALGALPDVRPPGGDWDALEARLVSEGLVRGPVGAGRGGFRPGWGQAVAGIFLFVAGMGVNAVIGNPPEAAVADSASVEDATSFTRAAQGARTVEEAAEMVRLTEQPYHAALSRYHELAGARREPDSDDPAVRMAALEAVLAASQAAVRQAPGDVFLNGILVSAAAEREAFLRRVASTRENWF